MSGETPELFLFAWAYFCDGDAGGIAFAIAETLEQAQQMIEQRRGYEVSNWGPLRQFPVTEPVAFYVSGDA